MTKAGVCQATVTSLSCDEALLVVEPYFLALKEEFLAAGYDRIRRTRLFCAPNLHDTPRHFAACRDDGSVVLFAPELAELDERMVLAVLAHECGHATDFLYPGEFVLGQKRAAVRRDREDFEPKQWARWVKSWQKRDDDSVEFTADAIAGLVMGVDIGYVGPCKIQMFAQGNARPRGLR